jgi:hypothetical protein
LYHPLLFSCYPWIGEYYEHNERGEYKPNIRTIRNNTGSNIFIYILYNITEYKTKCYQRVLKIYTNKETAVKQDNKTKTLCIGPCVVCPLGARKPNTKMPEIILLTSWQTTQGPDYLDRSGDGKHDPDNFRNNKNETKFWRPPQMRSKSVVVIFRERTTGLNGKKWGEGEKKGEGEHMRTRSAAEHRQNVPSLASRKRAADTDMQTAFQTHLFGFRELKTCVNLSRSRHPPLFTLTILSEAMYMSSIPGWGKIFFSSP